MNTSVWLGLSLCAITPSADSAADVVLQWNEAALMSIRAERTPPPMASRQLAILHIAMFDAVNSVKHENQHFEVNHTAPDATSELAAAANAAHLVLAHFYPNRARQFDALLTRIHEELGEGRDARNGTALGRYVGQEILKWRASDGAERTATHSLRTVAGAWSPTPPGFVKPLAPHWPRLRCFALRRGFDLRSEGPPALSSKEYTVAFDEVKRLGRKDSKNRTAEQTEIAHFWAGGEGTVSPPGHWNRIAQAVARERRYSIVESARLFALLNVAMADAAIACWDCKFYFDFWRPIHGIREAERDGNPDTMPDPDWEPLLITPPFPSYTSGHSSFSGAAATILAEVVGKDDYRFTSTSEGAPGATRRYAGFWSAAEEAGMSRIYGGIHWQFDNTDGLAGGKKVAQVVLEKCLKSKGR